MAKLKRLSDINKTKEITFFTEEVNHGAHCPMKTSSQVLNTIEGIAYLLIGMPECTIHSRIFEQGYEGKYGEHYLYVLDHNEVVFGARDGIIKALHKLNKEGVKKLMLINTCIPEIIGEDMEGIVFEIENDTDMKVNWIDLGQFKNISYNIGAWKTLKSLIKFMEPKEKENIINILGLSKEEKNNVKILGVLERKGYELNFIGMNTSMECVENAPKAVLNFIMSSFGYPLALEMEKKYNIPHVDFNIAYSSEEIKEEIRKTEELLTVDLEEEFTEDLKLLENYEEGFKKSGRKFIFAIGTRVDLPLSIGKYLVDLGNELSFVHLEELIDEEISKRESLLESGINPVVTRVVNQANLEENLKDIEFDAVIGSIQSMKKYAINIPDIFELYGTAGYERSINFMKKLLESNKGCNNGAI